MKVMEVKRTLKTGQTVVLRSPTAADSEMMLVYLRQLLRESWENLNYPANHYDSFDIKTEEEILNNMEKTPRSFMIAAFHEDKIISNLGMTILPGVVASHCGNVSMGVLKSHQGIGVGKLMVQYCIQEAARIGVWNLRLYVRTFNQPALKLYESFGFKQIGMLKQVAKVKDFFADEYIYQYLGERPTES
jgi:GNAT superfamily N-acetyltransferase